MRFDKPVDLSQIVTECVRPGAGPGAGAGTSMELPKLSGRVLYVEDQEEDQQLLEFHLKSLGVEMASAVNGLEALQMVEQQEFDAVITDLWLPGMEGGEVIESLRSRGYTRPIVVLTADEDPETKSNAETQGCTGFLAKPYTLDQLAAQMRDVLTPADNEAVPDGLYSTEWDNEPMRPLIRQFLQRLDEHIAQLAQSLEELNDLELIHKLCLDIKGSAGSYGYPKISETAATLYAMITQDDVDGEIEPVVQELRHLSDLARRIAV